MLRPLLAASLAIAAAATPAPAAAEVHELRADGFIVRHSVTLAASPLATWLMLTKPGEWWSDEHTWSGSAANMTMTPQGGGCWCERIPAESSDALAGSVAHGIVIQASPLKLLRLEASLGPLQSEPARGILTFALKPVGTGTMVQLEYAVGGTMRFKPAELAPVVDKVLGQQMVRLGAKLGPLDPAAAKGGEGQSVEEALDAIGNRR